MRKFFLLIPLVAMSSVLYAQTLIVSSDNKTVTGAVTAELMLDLKTNNGGPLIGNRFICHQVDGQYIIAIDLHDYNMQTTIIFDILKTKTYWVKNLKMKLETGSFGSAIQVIYPLNGRDYRAQIYIAFPG